MTDRICPECEKIEQILKDWNFKQITDNEAIHKIFNIMEESG